MIEKFKRFFILVVILILVMPSFSNETLVFANMNDNRQLLSSAPLDENRVIIMGGNNGINHLTSSAIYNLATDSWTIAANMNTARFAHAAVKLQNGKILAIGGNNFSDGVLQSTEIYDPLNDTWTTGAPMLMQRASHTAVTLPNGNVLVIGGGNHNNGDLKSTEIYNPTTNTWTVGPDMKATRKEHSAVLLDDGNVMVIGGTINGSMSNSVEIYNPTLNSWSDGVSLPQPRYMTSAATMADGRVYVIGGFDLNYTPLRSAAVYDPETNSWMTNPTFMNTGRLGHTSSTLANGKVIFVAGGAGNSGPTNSTEEVEPSLRTYKPQASVAAGNVAWGTEVTLNSKSQGATIYYTTDGNEPTIHSAVYNEPIEIDHAMTIKALAIKDDWLASQVMSESYNVTAVDSTINPTIASFDKNAANSADVMTTMALNGNTLASIANGIDILVEGTDYFIDAQNNVTITKNYLSSQQVGTTNLTFTFSYGLPMNLAITVQDTTVVNTPPTIADETKVTLANTSVSGIASGYDADSHTLTFSKVSEPTNGTATVSADGAWIYIPNNDFIGVDTFTIQVDDGHGGIDIGTVTIHVMQQPVSTFTMTYDGNTSTGGSVPIDTNQYVPGALVTVAGNVGDLEKKGYKFIGWNTKADGTGISYVANNTFAIGSTNVILYAKWEAITPPSNPYPNENGGATSPALPTSTTEMIAINVDGENGFNLAKMLITRTTEPDGTIEDKISITETIAKEIVQKASELGIDTVHIVIPDNEDKVQEVLIEISKLALEELNKGNLKLEIVTANAVMSIPTTSLANFNDDLYFRIIPMKSAEEKKNLENRAKLEEIVRSVAQDKSVQLVGRPMEISTNMQNREVSIVLPLKENLSSNVEERAKVLANLGIYIEHSDSTKELIQGTAVKMNDGAEGVQFTINKFSTFAVIYLGEKQQNHTPTIRHEAYIKGYGTTFRPNEYITRAQMATMLGRNLNIVSTIVSDYLDVPSTHNAYQEIIKVKQAGIMTGINSNEFNPSGSITRAQMAGIAYRWIKNECQRDDNAFDSCGKFTSTYKGSYKDVPTTHWAFESIQFMKEVNFMIGYEDQTFQPNEKLTRAQAVKVLNRLFKRGSLTGITTPTFLDVPMTHWAFGEIEEAVSSHEVKFDERNHEVLK
ncbi:kelch repeat-containing protein [Metasolibacillus sp.]|uniref:kelch repeat-containing protein n=1 Tax=Metasolibacillus sp. TaxID=2703680 RepID=UPI0025D5699A|nr:kelch repeat-containing protein [Metasolibacillus sp.]MCT6925491.1 S-layer homology domain-containing protein [Metasolibacillus sp.]MCT6941748.1 S-layer homology domain-containing protein [Metasolibacillus sp.]